MTPVESRAEAAYGRRRDGRPAVVLHATGLRHPGGPLSGGPRFTAYADLVHVVRSRASLRLGTRRGVFALRGDLFSGAAEMEALAADLVGRVASAPGGEARLLRMRRLDARMDGARPARVSQAVAATCAAVFVLQLLFAPYVDLAGVFSAKLVELGEVWRLVTANFLHGFPLHLVLNALGLLGLGFVVERILGSAATGLVLAASGLGAMGGGLLAGYTWAVGASGLVTGLVGALLWTEFRRPEALPALWRIPRAVLVGAVVGESALLLFVPGIAHAAHAGGLLAGGAAAALTAPPRDGRPPPRRRWLLAADGLAGALVLAAGLAAAWPALAPGSGITQARLERLRELRGMPVFLNDVAWTIATAASEDEELLALAEDLARRAVRETERENPQLLDTLAEVHFARGDRARAVEVIEEAIRLAPDERYFREQRRRFTGERPADDRPAPPSGPIRPRERAPDPAPPPEPGDGPGIPV